MKKNVKPIFLVLASLFLTVSCGKSDKPTDSISTGIPVDWTLPYTANDVYSMIMEMARGSNYTLTYQYEKKPYYIYINEDYAYYTSSRSGYVEIEDCQNNQETLLYTFTESNSKIKLEKALSYTLNGDTFPLRDAEELNYMALFLDEAADVELEDFETAQKGILSRNEDCKTIFANLMGYGDSAGYIDYVFFQLNETKDELTFVFYPNFEPGSEEIDGVRGTLSKVGTTAYEPVKQFMDSYHLPEEKLPASALSVLDSSFSRDIKVTRHWSDIPTTQLETKEVDLSEDKARVSVYYGTADFGKLQSPVVTNYVKKGENAFLTYIDTDNTIQEVDTGVTFDSKFVSPKEKLELAAFRKTGTDTYSYFGYQARQYSSLFGLYDIGVTESVTITLANGVLSKVVCKTPVFEDSYGRTYYTQVVVDFVSDRSIESLTSYTPNSDSARISSILSLFDGNTSFNAKIYTNGYKDEFTNMTVDNGIILYENCTFDSITEDPTDLISVYSGYQETSTGVQPFEVIIEEDEDWNVIGKYAKASDYEEEGKTLKDVIGFSASVDVMEINSVSGELVFKKNVDHLETGVLAGYYKEHIVPESFKINLDASNKPISLTYNYMMDNGFYLGKEIIEFSDWGTATLPSDIDFSDIGEFAEPTTWIDDMTPSDYADFQEVFTDEYIARIPYLYRKELKGTWQVSSSDRPDGYCYTHIFTMEMDAKGEVPDGYYPQFAKDYENYLISLGYEKSRDNAWGLEAYSLGDIHIRIINNLEQVDLFIFETLPN